MSLRERAAKLRGDVTAVYAALRAKDTPLPAKILAALTVAYALSPVDLIPDFIPVLGYLDDLIILPLMVAATIRLIPAPVMARCREEARSLWPGGRPKRWYYALPIVAVWGLLAWVVARGIIGQIP